MPAEMKNLSDKRGNSLGIGFFRVVITTLGPACACLFAGGVALFYALADRTARRAANPYLHRRFPNAGPLRQTWNFYRMLVAQGQVIILAHWLRTGHQVPIHEENPEFLRQALCDRQRGLILLISHVGCWQAALTCLATYQRPVNLLIQTNANRPIAELFTASQITVIPNDAPFGGLLACVAALERGEIVCIMGDRLTGAREQAAVTSFLGHPLAVPLSPWLLAARCRCPVVPVFTLMQGLARAITFHFAPPIEIAYDLPRKPAPETFAPHIRLYAENLERMARLHPYQIFHFEPQPEPQTAGEATWTQKPPASGSNSSIS